MVLMLLIYEVVLMVTHKQ